MTKSTKTAVLNCRINAKTRKSLEIEAAQFSKRFGIRVTISEIARKHIENAILQKALKRRKFQSLKGNTK